MINLTIGITAHSESITLHKTLLSVQRASRHLTERAIAFEVILQLDNPTNDTIAYSNRISRLIELPVHIQSSSFGDPGLARNDIIKSATGKYITFIDGDDLMSENWLRTAYQTLISKEADNTPNPYVAHTELTVEFGDVDSIVIKQGEIDKATDSLLSVYSNRWNVAIMIERSFLLANPYPPSPKGYGFEDWYINCQTIYSGFHNILIPETALFIRRKSANSVWLEQKSNYHVLRKNDLLSFKHIRSLSSSSFIENYSSATRLPIRTYIKNIVSKHALVSRVARKAHRLARQFNEKKTTRDLPVWLHQEWQAQHIVDKNLFPNLSPDYYETITPEHYQAADIYKRIVDSLSRDAYNYILFIPWVIKGGADLFAINYANSIAAANSKKHVLVITTINTPSPWKNKLHPLIDVIEFGTLTHDMPFSVQNRLMEQIIENSNASHLHIINAEFAYDFIVSHQAYIRTTAKKVIVTSFSQSINQTGRIFGYSHTHVPLVYDLACMITTDNQAVADMWVKEYGFDINKIRIHNQPVQIPTKMKQFDLNNMNSFRILWAARLSPEKQPDIVAEIAKLLGDTDIHIDMYGHIDEDFTTDFLNTLPSNVTYCGPYDGFDSLNPTEYDIYLYTSLFDGMPNSVLEAGSYGLPVIASAVGGLPELITDNQNGILVDDLKNANAYADAIKKITSNKKMLVKLGPALRTHLSEQYSEKAHKLAIVEMLKETKYL